MRLKTTLNNMKDSDEIAMFKRKLGETCGLILKLRLTDEDISRIPMDVIRLVNANTALSYHSLGPNDHDQWRYAQLESYIPEEKRLSPAEIDDLVGPRQLSDEG